MLSFLRHGTGQLLQPFSQLEIQSYTDGASGIVIHRDDIQLIDDWNIHIYYNNPVIPGATTKQYEAREVIVFEDTKTGGKTRPPILFVRDNGSLGEMNEITDFLGKHFYSPPYDEGESYAGSDTGDTTTDPYHKFVAEIDQHSSGSLEQYLREMLKSMGLEQRANLVIAYLNIFQVGFVAEDMNVNPLSNYELSEFVGDLASWKPLNDIFVEYAEKNNITLTEPIITSMHRSYASKEKQAEIAKRLHLYVFLKKKGEVTIDTYEDLFESFVGSLFMITFLIRSVLAIDLRLHEVFLRWVYVGMDLSGYAEKPEITEFYETMRVLVGISAFKERLTNGLWIMRGDRGVMEKVAQTLSRYDIGNEKKVKDIVDGLTRMIGKVYKDGEDVYELRRNKYQEINTFVKRFISPEMMRKMANDKNMADWNDDTRAEFVRLMSILLPDGYIVSERFTDKSRTSSYWIVQDVERELQYSTMNYDQGEDPDVLLSVIRDAMEKDKNKKVVIEEVKRIPYRNQPYYFQDDKGIWFLEGKPSDIEAYVSKAYEEEKGQFFLVLNSSADADMDEGVEYDPRPPLYMDKSINWDYLRGLFVSQEEDGVVHRPELPPTIHRYIGDRAAYGYTAIIAVLNHQITNPNHLTAVRNYYRSKDLKKEITRLLDIHNDEGELLSFDELVGMNLPLAEQIITYLYMHVIIDPSVLYTTEKRIEALRSAIFAKHDTDTRRLATRDNRASKPPPLTEEAKKKLQKDRITKSKIRVVAGEYVYDTSRDERLSIKVGGFNYARVKEAFADHILTYEQSLLGAGVLNAMRNARFVSMSGYDTLKQVMDFRNIEDWSLSWNWKSGVKRGITLRIYTPMGMTYINRPDIESIVKQL